MAIFGLSFYRPDDDEQLALDAQKSGIQPVQLQVLENDKFEVKRVYMGMVLLYGDKREVLPVIQTTTGLEYEITTRIKKMVDENRSVVGVANTGASAPAMERGECATQGSLRCALGLFGCRRAPTISRCCSSMGLLIPCLKMPSAR